MVYTGMTSNLIERVYKHKTNYYPNSFTATYNLHKLVYYEFYDEPLQAIIREKQIKYMPRDKKLKLIRRMNPEFIDLYYKFIP